MFSWVRGGIVLCFWVAYDEVSCMLGGIALGEVSVTQWRAVMGIDAMIEKSQSAISLRRKASFKARIEFGWSVERGTVDVLLESCGGSVGGGK